jgi:hypothetical protein
MELDFTHLRNAVEDLRRSLERHFQADTAAEGYTGTAASAGHCAAVALIVQHAFGGDLVSAPTSQGSHWFNRIRAEGVELDVDLTADQFGYDPVRISPAGHLCSGSAIRSMEDVFPETIDRSRRLADRAGLAAASQHLSHLYVGSSAVLGMTHLKG